MELVEPRRPMRHVIGVTLVVALHVGIIWALAAGLGAQVIKLVRPPVIAHIVEPPKVVPPPPPPPPTPVLAPAPPLLMPVPQVVIERKLPPPKRAPVAVQKVDTPPPAPVVSTAPPQPVAVHEPVVVPPDVSAARHCQRPVYPEAAQRLGIRGTVTIRMLVGLDGVPTDPKVEQSSGDRSLDEAALATLPTCHFVPGTVDGKPEALSVTKSFKFDIR